MRGASGEEDTCGRYNDVKEETADNTGNHTLAAAIFSAYKAGRESSGDDGKHRNNTQKPEVRYKEEGESRNGKSSNKQEYNTRNSGDNYTQSAA